MSFSIQRAVSDGSMVLLPISIEYFDRSEISVLFDGVVDARQWAWVGTTETAISFTPAVANLVEVSVRRSTDISEPRHQFSQGAQFTVKSLDEDIQQVLHIAQEAKEGSGLGEVYQNLNFHGFKAINMGNGSGPGDAVNHAQMEVHDATIIGYRDAAAASAVDAAASAATIDASSFPTKEAHSNTIPVVATDGLSWLYKTVGQVRTWLGLGSAAYSDSTSFASSGSIAGAGLTMATAKLLGRTTVGTGAVEEVGVGNGLSLSGGSVVAALDTEGVGIGYGTGAGGSVTQLTGKSTGVVLNKIVGNITLNNSYIASGAYVGFSLTNSKIASNDTVLVTLADGFGLNYNIWSYNVNNGNCSIAIRNISAGPLTDAVVIKFIIIKGATS